jgi:hypothetical protein
MKLADYIKHLQDLQEKYAGLDIEVAQPHRDQHPSDGLFVIPAKAPEVLPVEIDESNPLFVRQRPPSLDADTKPKGSGPDGIILVLDVDKSLRS